MSDSSGASRGPANDPMVFPTFSQARRVRAELVARILRGGRSVPDESFDDVYPDAVRRASSVHWTPVRVCERIVRLLRLGAGDRVLDVGAGAGKFCIVAAAMSGARIRGIERLECLADVAREAARRLRVDVDIASGTFEEEAPERFDAIYLFNPFRESLLLPGHEELAADRSASRGARDILAAEAFLAKARAGTRLVTYCGFGGTVPPDYERLEGEAWDGGALELWVKGSDRTRPSLDPASTGL